MALSSAELNEWALNYVKSRDAHFRNIVDIRQDKDNFLVRFKDKEVLYLAEPVLKAEGLDKDKNYVITSANTNENFDLLIRRWNDLSRIRGLVVYFVNPHSSTETKWIINPYVHSKICDDASLKTGIRAIFETV